MPSRIAVALPAALLAAGFGLSGGAALAAPCEWHMEDYGPPPRPDATLTCTCGPPSGLTLDLGELTEDLEPDGPEPFEGTLLQQVGGAQGSWTYSASSNLCIAARHAGLIADPEIGAEIRVQVAPGCPSYAGSTRHGVTTIDRGPYAASFFFPSVSGGGCVGEPGHLPERLRLAEFEAWSAYAFGNDDGSWSCAATSDAAGRGLWLHVNAEGLIFRPNEPVPDDARLRPSFDGVPFLLPMAVGRGRGILPIGVAAPMLAGAAEFAITVTAADGPEVRHAWPVAGLADAFASAAAECGWERAELQPEG